MSLFKKWIITPTSAYLDACPNHPNEEVEWHWSEYFCQHVPRSCQVCEYESQRRWVLEARAKGRLKRKEQKEKSRESARGMYLALKCVYDSYSKEDK